jgi:hypothetical protein
MLCLTVASVCVAVCSSIYALCRVCARLHACSACALGSSVVLPCLARLLLLDGSTLNCAAYASLAHDGLPLLSVVHVGWLSNLTFNLNSVHVCARSIYCDTYTAVLLLCCAGYKALPRSFEWCICTSATPYTRLAGDWWQRQCC